MYHVINRGNYRDDVFGSVGAAKAFEQALGEACEMYNWRVGGYVVMRNHFHLAVETPEPNLVDGMHWLQTTYATRFNRLRNERGHLFEGRYQALLIEDAAALARVVDYIHLNPVRAKIVAAENADSFRWSSLGRFRRGLRPKWLAAERWLTHLGLSDNQTGWHSYCERLSEIAAKCDPKAERDSLCRGWAIGTAGWREAIAKEHRQLAVTPGIAAEEVRELKHARWSVALEHALKNAGRESASLSEGRKGAEWKRELAAELRRGVGASHAWLAEHLHMGSANSVRAWLNQGKG